MSALDRSSFGDIYYLAAKILTRSLHTTSKSTVLRLAGLSSAYQEVHAMSCLRILHSQSASASQALWNSGSFSSLRQFMASSSLPMDKRLFLRKPTDSRQHPSIPIEQTPDGWYVDGCFKHRNYAGCAAIKIQHGQVTDTIGGRLMGP